MKRTIFTIILGAFAMMFFASPVLASTGLSISPSSVNVKEGQSFDIIVTVNPKSVNNYTVKLQLQYPADILNLESFTFSDDWMAFSGTGYDLVDNTNGILIKTAGFPSGVSTLVPFGTVSFSVKKGGEGVIKVGDESFVLDGESKNVFDGLLKEAGVKVTAIILPEETVIETAGDEESEGNATDSEEEIISAEEDIEEVALEETISDEEESTSSPALFDVLTSPATQQVQKRSYLTIFWITAFVLLPASYVLYRRRNKKLYNRKTKKKQRSCDQE